MLQITAYISMNENDFQIEVRQGTKTLAQGTTDGDRLEATLYRLSQKVNRIVTTNFRYTPQIRNKPYER